MMHVPILRYDSWEAGVDEQIEQNVSQHGWFAASILDHAPPFLYSVGLMQSLKHPEFIVFGLDSDDAYALIDALIAQIRQGQRFDAPGIRDLVIGSSTHRVGLRAVDATQHPLYLGYAMGFVRSIGRVGELEAMQVFWPDEAGRFPFEPGCDDDVEALQPRLDILLSDEEVAEWERQWE